jgi:hypothetical protein
VPLKIVIIPAQAEMTSRRHICASASRNKMSESNNLQRELRRLEAAIKAQEEMLAPLKDKRDEIEAKLSGSGAIAQGEGAVVAGREGVAVGGHVVVAKDGATVVISESPIPMTEVDRRSALGRYLRHIISRNRYLQLQGIRSSGKVVHIELDQIYIRLRTTQQRVVETEERWLAHEAALAPGEKHRFYREQTTETVVVTVEKALADNPRLVVLGDPGCGKTTLLRYLALPYARDLAEGSSLVKEKLELDEPKRLPILLALRQIGSFLRYQPDDGTEGHILLLDFLLRSLAKERIDLSKDFFDEWLNSGNAVILFDGLDEVPDPDLRRRVSHLVERFTQAYPECRYMVTSRIVGYTDTAKLGESYAITTVRDFTLDDVEQFLNNWHKLIALGQMGDKDTAKVYAAQQTHQLMEAIRDNSRIRDLAINPLMLTVIAMVHRDRVKLPDRRAELYAEAIDVLLGKWEEAKGVQEIPVFVDKPFDTGDKRLVLQSLALHMHEKEDKEIDVEALRKLLQSMFLEVLRDQQTADQAVTRFLSVIQERTGLLVARGEGVYAFSHLTFQEYLAALAVAAKDDYIRYTLNRVAETWWREVILLEAGFLSTQSKERTTRLIRSIADSSAEPAPYHNLVLAAECLRDVGGSRIQGNLEENVQVRLLKEVETPPPFLSRFIKKLGVRGWIEHRSKAMEALVRAGSGFWTMPYGEPEWVKITAGEFWMGSENGYENEKPQHKLFLESYRISKVPVTNAQYYLFTKDTGHKAPLHWEEDRPPKNLESHPVVNVTWHDAIAYCAWLSGQTGKSINLPSEAQWEKAARGDRDKREYPWGNTFEVTRCNNLKLGLGTTTPVGIFLDGASPYGCLDMAGNVWEWTCSKYAYNYDGSEQKCVNKTDDGPRSLRGGSWSD